MHDAFLGVAPKLFVHGHYHVVGEAMVTLTGCDYDTRIWSLNCDGVDGNVRYLDLSMLDEPAT
jgi:hypothetical protein